MGIHYLKKWICPNDGKHNLGCEFECPSCNGPRTKDVKWYVPDPLIEATDEQWKYMGKGPNWFCNYCGCENPEYNKTNCLHCGGPIGKAKTVKKVRGVPLSEYARDGDSAKSSETFEVDHGDAGWNIPDEQDGVKYTNKPKSQSRKSQKISYSQHNNTEPEQVESLLTQIPWLQLGGAATLAVIVAVVAYFIWYWNFDTTTQTATVSGWYWEQRVDEYHYQTLSKTDWASEMPADAYNESCTNMLREANKQVPDGYEDVPVNTTCTVQKPVACDPVDDGNGGITIPSGCTEPDQEPCTKTERKPKYKYIDVYEDKCTYNVDRWVFIQSFPTSGYDHSPYYFNTPVSSSNVRYDQIPGTYTVFFSSEFTDPSTFTFNYNYNTWLLFTPDKLVSIEVNRQNTVPWAPEPTR